MDDETRVVLKALAEGHDRLATQIAALTVIVGALAQREPPDEKTIIAWSRSISEHSVNQSQTAIHNMVLGLLRGPDLEPGNTDQKG